MISPRTGFFRAASRMGSLLALSLLAPFLRPSSAPPQDRPANTVAVTMDDLPVQRIADFERQREIFGKLIKTLRSRHIPLIGFVNESKLLTDGKLDAAKVDFLKSWTEAGFDLGNHTYAHSSANEVPIERYEEDILAGESVIRKLTADKGKALKYFRPPFLHTGRSLETRRAIEDFLAARGCGMAPVTIDNSEWIFAAAYEKAKTAGDAALMKKIGDDYIGYMRSKFEWYERKAGELFGRPISQILLVHANRLNADRFGDLCAMIRGRGYRFVSLDEALKDEAYKAPDTFTGRGGISWIDRWAITAGKKKEFFAGEPRTPAYIMTYAGVASE